MNATTNATESKGTAVDHRTVQGSEEVFVPDVDILENRDAYLLVANMPGVENSAAEVTVENGVLTLSARTSMEDPSGYERVGQEYALAGYRRAFDLSDTIDVGRIHARMKNGVLEVTLPKREELKSRKVEIKAG